MTAHQSHWRLSNQITRIRHGAWIAAACLIASTSAAAPTTQPAAAPTAAEQRVIRSIQCADHLHRIFDLIASYSIDHNGAYPPDLATLASGKDVDLSIFVCPAAPSAMPADTARMTPQQKAAWVRAHSDSTYRGAGWSMAHAQPDALLAYERDDDHGDGAMNVLFGDGHTAMLPVDEVRKRFGPAVGAERRTTRVPPVPGKSAAIPLISLDQAKALLAKWAIEAMGGALDAFEIDNGRFPTTQEGLAALVRKPAGNLPGWSHPYLADLPNDPWGHPYVYRSPGTGGRDYDLFSAGPDGRPGTADDVKH